MNDLNLLLIPAFALAVAAYLVWHTRRGALRNERDARHRDHPAE